MRQGQGERLRSSDTYDIWKRKIERMEDKKF